MEPNSTWKTLPCVKQICLKYNSIMGCEIQRIKSGVLSRQAMRVLWTIMLNFQPHYTIFSINALCSIFFFSLSLSHNSSIEETKYTPCRYFNQIQNVTPCLPIIWSNRYSQLTITSQLPRCSGTWCAAQNHFLPPAPPGCSSPACRRGGDTQVQVLYDLLLDTPSPRFKY